MSKVRIIAVTNQKGGVGKTTTAINLAASLGKLGKKTLLIDTDPQGNSTSGLGVDKNQLDASVYNVLLGEISLSEAVIGTGFDNLDIAPANINLSGAEIELVSFDDREYLLRECVQSVKDDYDFIIIDCPPSLNILTINSLAAADTVLVPIQCEYFALEGLEQLLYTIRVMKDSINPELQIEGVVFTMFDSRTNLSIQVVDEIKRSLPAEIYKAIIPRNVRLGEAPSHGLPITEYDPRSKGAESYMELAQLVIERKWN
ncbi:MAG: ParA family protein [Firmicutes bacterium]|nr:ParA family protein [Bacillota bacterium]MBR0104097.1 ParA family protein [Bacillota bacterium]